MNRFSLKLTGLFVMLFAVAFLLKDKLMPGTFSENSLLLEEEREREGEERGANIDGAYQHYMLLKGDLETGRVDLAAARAVQAELASRPQAKADMGSWLQWKELGPDNVGGRCRAIVIDRNNRNIVYAGGVTGGVWKSVDAGTTWKRAGNLDLENVNVASMTQGADGALYYGTGEDGFTNGNADGNSGSIGRGVYKSTDGGATWAILKSTDPGANVVTGEWNNVHYMNADPNIAGRIYAGNDKGLKISDDGGATWKDATGIPTARRGKEIQVSPDGKTVFAAISSLNGQAYLIYRSTDGGNTFDRIGDNTLSTGSCSYVIAISRSNPNVVYLSSAAVGARYGMLDKIYRSEDNGTTWEIIAQGDDFFNPLASQGYYDHAVVVDPKNPDRMLVAGLNIWEGKKVGSQFQFTQLTNWNQEFIGTNSTTRNPYYVHADQHTLIFDNHADRPVLYIGCDGGVSKSTDFTYNAKPTFFNADFGFNTVQFYGIGVSAYNPREVIGGSQDNGVIRVDEGGLTLLNGTDIRGGDGGYSEISKINPTVYFGEYVYGQMFRSFNRGGSWSEFFDNHIPAAGSGARYEFIAIMHLWESLNDPTSVDSVSFIDPEEDHKAGETIKIRSNNGVDFDYVLTQALPKNSVLLVKDIIQAKFFVGANSGLWMTKQALVAGVTPTFFKILDAPGMVIQDIQATKDGNTVYICGVEGGNGVAYRVTGLNGKKLAYDGNDRFTPSDYGITQTRIFSVSSQNATGIAVDENDDNHVIVVYGTYGKPTHVYRSKNAMDASPTFTSIQTNLPQFPVYDAVISNRDNKHYFLATEFGIWSSKNQGSSWQEENWGMERVPTFQIKQMKYNPQVWGGPNLYIATHGRGVFYTETLFTGINEEKEKNIEVSDISIYPNPAMSNTNVAVNLPKNSGVNISIYDIQGKEISNRTYNNQLSGKQVYNLETSQLRAGTYFIRLTASGVNAASRLVIMK